MTSADEHDVGNHGRGSMERVLRSAGFEERVIKHVVAALLTEAARVRAELEVESSMVNMTTPAKRPPALPQPHVNLGDSAGFST